MDISIDRDQDAEEPEKLVHKSSLCRSAAYLLF